MNPVALIAIAAGALFAMSRKHAEPTPDDAELENADDVAAEAKRIVQESKEIVQGKRDSYSDFPGQTVSPEQAAARVKTVIDQVKSNTAKVDSAAEDLIAQKAAREAEKQAALEETHAIAPQPKPVQPKPVQPKPKPHVIQLEPQTITASPSPSPSPSPPPGFDRVKASNAAADVARHITKAKFDYSRQALKAWQKVAGIPQDGVYGPASRNALAFYTPGAPKPLFLKGPNGPYPNTPYPWGG